MATSERVRGERDSALAKLAAVEADYHDACRVWAERVRVAHLQMDTAIEQRAEARRERAEARDLFAAQAAERVAMLDEMAELRAACRETEQERDEGGRNCVQSQKKYDFCIF